MKFCSCVHRNGSNGGARGGKLKAEPAEGLTTESSPHRTSAGGLNGTRQDAAPIDGARSRSEAAARAGSGTALRAPVPATFRTPDRRNRRVEASALPVRAYPAPLRDALRGLLGAGPRFAAPPASFGPRSVEARHSKQIGTSIAFRKSLTPLAHHCPARSAFVAMRLRTNAARRQRSGLANTDALIWETVMIA